MTTTRHDDNTSPTVADKPVASYTQDEWARYLREQLAEFDDYNNTHYGDLFNQRYQQRARFVLTGSGKNTGADAKLKGAWIVWDDMVGHWQYDQPAAHDLAKQTAKEIYEVAKETLDTKGDKKSALTVLTDPSVILRAAAHSSVAIVRPELLNRDPYLLKVKNGTLDLRQIAEEDGVLLREDDPDDFITMGAGAAYDPEAECPQWLEYLERVQPDSELRQVLQTMVGYSLTGDTTAHCFWCFQGKSRAGKGVFKDVSVSLLGDYGHDAPFSEFLKTREERSGPKPELLSMFGKRLVFASETKRDAVLDDALVKNITGSDKISARNLYEGDVTSQVATFKVALISNYPPVVHSNEDGIWERVRRVPWEVSIPYAERDEQLTQRIVDEELAGVLNWALEGLAYWFEHGKLPLPAAVEAANKEYRAEMDPLAVWIDENIALDPEGKAYNQELFSSYTKWCEDSKVKPLDVREFGKSLRANQELVSEIEPFRDSKGGRGYRGLKIVGVPF